MTNVPEWFARSVALLTTSVRPPSEGAAPAAAGGKTPAERSTHERLEATLRRGEECLSPRALRRLLTRLQDVIAPRVSEVEGARLAQDLTAWYAEAQPGERVSPPT